MLKHPYDEELKRLGLAFAVLLKALRGANYVNPILDNVI